MKIMMCGKGGCGKSTVSSLLAKEFAARGFDVLVLDTDESNFGLHRQLGLPLPPDFIEYFGQKEDVLKLVMASQGAHSFISGECRFANLPVNYVSEKGRIHLMSVGKITEAGEGCACPFGVITQQFISNLKPERDEIVLVDTEAGVEHFGRGTDNSADAIFMVVDPSYESLKLAGKVSELCKSIGKPLFFVLNKVTPDIESTMSDTVRQYGRIAGILPAYNTILQAGLKGYELQADYDEIARLADFCQEL